MLSNDVLFKCSIPSFVSDFVSVVGWVSSEGSSYTTSQNTFGKVRADCVSLVNIPTNILYAASTTK